jgi:hypothetical protein
MTWGGQSVAYDNTFINKTTELNQDLSGVLPAHPEGKKPGGYMLHVYIYIEGERNMIYDCILYMYGGFMLTYSGER